MYFTVAVAYVTTKSVGIACSSSSLWPYILVIPIVLSFYFFSSKAKICSNTAHDVYVRALTHDSLSLCVCVCVSVCVRVCVFVFVYVLNDKIDK